MSTRKFESVLYVDDDPDICSVVQATLRLVAGLNVRTAGSGEQAIDLAYELRPDLVLMDVMMPGLDGPSTLRRMRESVLLADIPIIFMTAKVLPAEIARFLQLGATGVIVKPFDPLKLYDELVALLNNQDIARRKPIAYGGQSQLMAQERLLTDSFLHRARADAIRLGQMIRRARDGDRSVFKEVERVAHSIHGAGAMFGFPEVSKVAGTIERLVEDLIASTGARSSVCEQVALKQLFDCSEQLAQDVEAAGHTEPNSAGMFQGSGRGR
jgi:two-component system, OmpR family, response regulator